MMPAFIKSKKDESVWSKAKAIVEKGHPRISKANDKFWALTTAIYKKLRGKKMEKSASSKIMQAMRKLAYVPLTPAAEEAVASGQPPMDPGMMPPPEGMPMDPSMMGGMPPQGGMPADPGAMGGQPQVDPETGFIIVDPVNGIEQEPLTGILFVKPTGEFMTPDGQPIPPEQAQQIIAQAMMQAQGGMPPQGEQPMDPSMMGGQPPMDPAMAQGMPMDPSMMQQMPPPEAMPPMPTDPAAQMASGGPVIDPQSGLPIDPATGMFVQPGASAPEGAGLEGGLNEAMPGFEQFVDQYNKTADRQDKLNKRILHDLSGTRTDIQGVRREIQQLNDNQDTLLTRLENILNVLERLMGPRG